MIERTVTIKVSLNLGDMINPHFTLHKRIKDRPGHKEGLSLHLFTKPKTRTRNRGNSDGVYLETQLRKS